MILTPVEILKELQQGEGLPGEVHIGEVQALLPDLVSRYEKKVQLIYIDPPFSSDRVYQMRARVGEREWKSGQGSLHQTAYDDRYEPDAYLAMMREVIRGAHALLSDTGVMFLHVDYRMHAPLRLLMDELFGAGNFLNEIIWTYQTGGRAQKFFSRKHDVILFYRKTRKYYFNIRAVPIERADNRRNHMKRHVDADGRTYRSIKSGGKIYTYYDDEPTYPSDVWDDVSHLQQKDPQRTGYDTQKPLRLLNRIVLCASKPGDLVCDLFAGSGTTLESAMQNGRRFLGCDRSAHAFQVIRRRMTGANVRYSAPNCAGEPTVEAAMTPAIACYEVALTQYTLEPGVCARNLSGMDALDNWSVGYLRGDEFVAYAHEMRTRHQPALTGRLELPILEGQPCIRVSDVLGRYFYYLLEGGSPLRKE